MSYTNKVALFKALVNGDIDAVKGCSDDVDFNNYFTIEIPSARYCLCHVEYELFRGSPEEMLSRYADAVASGKCKHCDDKSTIECGSAEAFQLRATWAHSDYFQYFDYCEDNEALNSKIDGGLNAVQIAVLFGHQDIIKWLINIKGASLLSLTEHMRETTLNLAAIQGNVEIVEFLLDKGVPIECYSEVVNISPAVYATYFDHAEVLKCLIECKADLNHEGAMFDEPLEVALNNDSTKCVELLLGAQKDISITLLFKRALEENQRDMAKLCLNFLDVNEKYCDDYGRAMTPLLIAATLEDTEMLKLLVEKGADLEGDIGDKYTVLFFAVFQNLIDLAEQLVQLGSSVNHINDTKYSPLHFAAWDGQLEISKLLLANGAEHDTQTQDKNTALALACHGNHLNVIELLLPLNCKVNNQDKDLDTPLLYTTFNGNVKATHLLLEHGADPQLANRFGTTPVWNAVYSKNLDLIHHFIELNVDLDCPSIGIKQHAHQADVVPVYSEAKSLLYVAHDRLLQNVPTLLVLAGLDLSKESWVFNHLSESLPHQPGATEGYAVTDELLNLVQNVRTLKQACRVCIRRMLKHHLPRDVLHLGLPTVLQDYLCCKVF